MVLPLPKVVADVGPGGPLVTSLLGTNALTKSNFENVIKQSEAEYAPYTNYANAASKIAYSQFVGPQAIASIINNPATRGMFTRSQYTALANAFANQVKNPAMTMANLPVPSQQRPGGILGLVNFIAKLAGINTPSQNAVSRIPSSSNGFNPISSNVGSDYASQDNNFASTSDETNVTPITTSKTFESSTPITNQTYLIAASD